MDAQTLERAWQLWHQEHDAEQETRSMKVWGPLCNRRVEITRPIAPTSVDWQAQIITLFNKAAEELRAHRNETVRLTILERDSQIIREELKNLRCQYPTVTIIDTMAPEPYDVIRPIHITITPHENEYQAALVDACLYAYGDTKSEATWNLKDMIVACYDSLSAHGRDRLGPGPARQLEILTSLIRKRR